MKPRLCLSFALLVWIFFRTVSGAEVTVEGVVTAVKADDRTVSLERRTATGKKETVFQVAKEAGDISGLTVGDEVVVLYDSVLELITRLDASPSTNPQSKGGRASASSLSAHGYTLADVKTTSQGERAYSLIGTRALVSSTLAIPLPIGAHVITQDGDARWYEAGYSTLTHKEDSLIASGTILTSNGSVIAFTDTYRIGESPVALRLMRAVRITQQAVRDIGYATRFAVSVSDTTHLRSREVFIPGIWYRNNTHLPKSALAEDLTHEAFIVREDRLPLPCVALRDPESKTVLSLTHARPDGRSFVGDRGIGPVIDDRMQFGSLGVLGTRHPVLAFVFPGAEGERTYLAGRATAPRWAERFHPIKEGAEQNYELHFAISHSDSFAEAVSKAWGDAYASVPKKWPKVRQQEVYEAGVEVLQKYWAEYDGVPGFPFSVNLPDGSVKEVSLQMGFVGQQVPGAVHLLRYGMKKNMPQIQQRGTAIVDFWTQNALSEAGVPRTWYDVQPNRWRDYGTFLRIASDGAVGVLNAWRVMQRAGVEKPQWLEFCEKWGDWLGSHQNPDGSFFRQYDFNGSALQDTKLNTTHPIRFLVDLARATGNPRYLETATRAGTFARRAIHQDYKYVGGTPDNPDVVDKEAGLIAFDAFLSLYDATKDAQWLSCAEQAATYAETWMYCWNVPMVDDDPGSDFPKGRSTVGMSLIATGHSGADSFMSYYSFAYWRLYLYTGKEHYRDVAELILSNSSRQLQDLDGSLGYALRGLHTEAMTIAVQRGYSVKLWLPWLTVATLDPLVDLEEVFGAMDIVEIEKRGIEELKKRNEAYGQTRGFKSSVAKRDAPVGRGWVYLDDLKETAVTVGHGVLGKNGSHGYGDAKVSLAGKRCTHSLSMHPPKDGTARVSYRTSGKWRQFRASVGISDSAPKPVAEHCIFTVTGDGKQLWSSGPISGKGKTKPCEVAIEGVQTLTLEVTCKGDNAWAFTIWTDPQVLLQ